MLVAAAATIVFVACSSAPEDDGLAFSDFVGSWVLTGGIEMVDDWPATLEISEGKAWGRLCDSYPISLGPDGFVLGDSTSLSCEAEVDAFEEAFMRAVDGATPAVVADQLVVTGADSELTFERRAEMSTTAMLDVVWQVDKLILGGDEFRPPASAWVEFSSDATFRAWTGCRSLEGTFKISEQELASTDLVSAGGPCAPHLEGQDTAMSDALTRSAIRGEEGGYGSSADSPWVLTLDPPGFRALRFIAAPSGDV